MFWNKAPRVGGDGHNVLADGSKTHLRLYKYDSCPFCAVVYRAIDGLQVNIEYRDINENFDHRKELYEVTGRTSVPCLFIDKKPMFESRDIAAWLQARFPRAVA